MTQSESLQRWRLKELLKTCPRTAIGMFIKEEMICEKDGSWDGTYGGR